MNYLDMIPSNTEREYLKNKGFALSDKMTATLIYHAVTDYHDRMSRLEAYAGETTDKGLSEQIKARIQHENQIFERFVSNDGQYIFLVRVDNSEDIDYELKGIFKHFKEAEDYACERFEKNFFVIEKYDLVDGELPEHRSFGHFNPNMLSDKTKEYKEYIEEYDCDSIGAASYKHGRMSSFWCMCSTIEEEDAVNEYDVNRFENLFIPWIHPFEEGDIVYSTDYPSVYGIVDTSQDSWKDFLERVKNGLYVDYIDASLTVQFLMEDGHFSHNHISPIYLEKVEMDTIKDSDMKELLRQAAWMVQGDMSLDYFCDTYADYLKKISMKVRKA